MSECVLRRPHAHTLPNGRVSACLMDMNDFEWDDNEWPIAYLITIRTYGTWLHGDKRSSVDLRRQNVYDTPRVRPNAALSKLMADKMKGPPFLLDGRQLRWS